MRRGCSILSVCLALVATAPAVRSQPDRVEEFFDQMESALRRGRDARAIRFGEMVLKEEPGDFEVMELLLPALLNAGEYGRALELSERLLDGRPGGTSRSLRAQALWAVGRVREAKETLAPWTGGADDPFDLDAARQLAVWLVESGNRAEAERLFEAIIAAGKSRVLRTARELVAYAEACRFIGGRGAVRQAEKDLAEAQRLAREAFDRDGVVDPLPSLRLGSLYLERLYLPGDAVEEYRAALAMRPGLAEAYWGLHQAFEVWQKSGESRQALRDTLRVNPRFIPALVAMSLRDLGDIDVASARKRQEQAKSVHAGHPAVMTVDALILLMEGDPEGFERLLGRIVEAHPAYSEAHLMVARVLNERRRWEEARLHMEKAVALSPKDPVLWDELARFSFFLGLEEAGMEALKAADRMDGFSHPWRTNMFEVMAVLRAYYEDSATPRFLHRFHRRERAYLERVVGEFCERSYDLLAAKYGYESPGLPADPGRILVEWFRDHNGFSVRTLGMKHLGATGVCFGPFICMDSPGSREPGDFSWARTFHHELAHTMTLGLSKGRVPRWLTEGLSTMEETAFDPSWDRSLYRDLFDAWSTGDLLGVLEFDRAFSTPRIAFAYFQGGLVCQFMEERFGFDRILRMLDAYGRDRTTAEILPAVLGVDGDEFDRQFAAWTGRLLKDVRFVPRVGLDRLPAIEERLKENPGDRESAVLRVLALAGSGSRADALDAIGALHAGVRRDLRVTYALALLESGSERLALFRQARDAGLRSSDVEMALGAAAEAAGDREEARTRFRAALEMFPFAAGDSDPRLALARLAEAPDERIRYLEGHLRTTFEDLAVRDELIRHYREAGSLDDELRHLRAKMLIHPLEETLHEELGRAAALAGAHGEAVLHLKAALDVFALLPPPAREPAREEAILWPLAKILAASRGDAAEAEAYLKRVLEISPGRADAKDLMSEIRKLRSGDDR